MFKGLGYYFFKEQREKGISWTLVDICWQSNDLNELSVPIWRGSERTETRMCKVHFQLERKQNTNCPSLHPTLFVFKKWNAFIDLKTTTGAGNQSETSRQPTNTQSKSPVCNWITKPNKIQNVVSVEWAFLGKKYSFTCFQFKWNPYLANLHQI